MKKRSGAEALVESLDKAGVEIVFGYPGANVIGIFNALRRKRTRFVLGRHEQGCVHMADGYARTLGRPGVVLVTSGPGLTNTITGLGTANMDGVPMVLICGQVPLNQIGTDAFQEADTTGLTRSVSKHNFLVQSADEIPETVAQAFYIATHGKPGPVVIDIPANCQEDLTEAKYPERVSLRAYHPEVYASPSEVSRLAKLINEAKRPLIYAGGGVIASGAAEEVRRLAHKASIPVVTTMMGLGAIDEHDEFALGLAGIYGSSAAKQAVESADLILALGMRFNDRTTGEVKTFARKTKLVHVDCDPASINKNVTCQLGIVADIKDLLTTVDSRITPAKRPAWIKAKLDNCAAKRTAGIRSREVVEAVSKAVKGDVIVATDVGQHQLAAAKYFQHVYPRHFITSGGMGAMGFGIPAAIGAALARPEHKVVALVGDGGAQMTAEELIVAVTEKLPVTFVVFRNDALGLVGNLELENPDFVRLAAAYGMKAVKVTDKKQLDGAIARALRTKAPVLVEVQVVQEETV